MSKSLFIVVALAAVTVAGCNAGDAKEVAKDGGPARSSGTPSGAPRVSAPATRTLAAGSRIDATIQDALSSRTNKSGEAVRATVSSDVADARGNVVIPAGSTVILTIDKLEPGSDQVRPEGRLMLDVTSVTVRGDTHSLSGTLGPIPHTMKGRGITKDEAARVAGGAAVGAVVGQVIGKNTKGTVIGGAVGAVAGGAVAARYAYRDIIVTAGTPVVITTSQAVTVSAR